MRRLFTLVTPSPVLLMGGCWILLFVVVWTMASTSTFIPPPFAVWDAFHRLWYERGLGEALWFSFSLNLEAISIMFMISYSLAITTVLPGKIGQWFRPLAKILCSGRFNGFVGLPLVFTALLTEPHKVKVALLVYGMGVFTLLSLVTLFENIPKDLYDHARTLRMNEWRVVWDVVVLGRFDEVIDILRINIAMGWMMLPMVEGRFKFEGGVGAMMEIDAKYFDYAAVFCALFVILGVGLVQDWVIGKFKELACPYSTLGLER